MKIPFCAALTLSACLLHPAAALAGVSAEEAAKLKGELTPFGAEKAGNKEGTIPAWTGGYTQPIPGYVTGGVVPDPFAADKPLFTITPQNQATYADKLSEGVKALLTKFGFTPERVVEVAKQQIARHASAKDVKQAAE